MQLNILLQFGGLLIVSFAAAFCAIWLFTFLGNRNSAQKNHAPDVQSNVSTFLFDGRNLVDATENGRHLLAVAPNEDSDWTRFIKIVEDRFRSFETDIEALPEQGRQDFTSADGASSLVAQWQNGLVRIVLTDAEANQSKINIDPDELTAMRQEIETLRATAQAAPFLVWRETSDGMINWANSAYLELSGRCDPDSETPTWPPARLFVPSGLKNMDGASESQRATTHIPGETEPRWFECFESPLGDDKLFTAVSADKIVRAEVSLRDFVQTLTKTFAHLKIGLAVFDKQRRLALFNPALTDLTSLPADFLSSKPTLQALLGKLRDKRMIPEQRDFKTWRQQIFELETAAQKGTFEETWSLATGQTYRVTGHPHPDGALAFLIEDISAEVSLTRRFRMELETGQAVLDTLDEAISVFSPSGLLTLSNERYARLWSLDSSEVIGSSDIIAATRCWADRCAPTPVWGDAREFVGTLGDRAEWSADVRLTDGRNLCCRFRPLHGGGTLVEFSFATAALALPVQNFPATLEEVSV